MSSKPENLRKGVTYYLTLRNEGHARLMRATFLGRNEDGSTRWRWNGYEATIPVGNIAGANAVRS